MVENGAFSASRPAICTTYVCAVVGLPEIVWVAGSKVSPGGSAGVAQVSGATGALPSVGTTSLKSVWTRASWSSMVAIEIGGSTRAVAVAVAVSPSVSVTVTLSGNGEVAAAPSGAVPLTWPAIETVTHPGVAGSTARPLSPMPFVTANTWRGNETPSRARKSVAAMASGGRTSTRNAGPLATKLPPSVAWKATA